MVWRLFSSKSNPYGPGLKKIPGWNFNLSDISLGICLPLSNTNIFGESKTNFDININDLSEYSFNPEIPGGQGLLTIFSRMWSYWAGYGETSHLGYAEVGAMVVYVPDLPEGNSCFCPEHLEQATLRFDYFSGPGKPVSMEELEACPEPVPKDFTPNDWCVRNINGVDWVNYQIHKWHPFNEHNNLPQKFVSVWITPLSDVHYLRIVFPCSGWQPEVISQRILSTLIEIIMSTAKVSLSPESMAQKQTAQSCWPDVKYSKTRQPENWVYEELVYRQETDTTEHVKASPAPEWQP